MTVGRFDDSPKPSAWKRLSVTLVDHSSKEKDFDHLTLYFWEDGAYADVAWTVKYSTTLGTRVSAIINEYGMRESRSEGAGEAKKALNSFLMILDFEELARELEAKVCKAPPPKKPPSEQDLLRKMDPPPFRGVLGEHIEQRLVTRKKPKWSREDVCQLINLRLAGEPLKVIAQSLCKPKKSVVQMLEALGTAPFEQPIVDEPQEVPDALRSSLFEARLRDIWHVLSHDLMTVKWKKAIAEISTEELLSTISQSILPEVKHLLGGVQPPTFAQIRALPSTTTNQAGVYARLVESRFEHQGPGDRLLYIGSASKRFGGLQYRILQHQAGFKIRGRESRLDRDIKERDLEEPGEFRTLLVMDMNSADLSNVETVRRTVVVAEAILTVWLGALQGCSADLRRASPWLPETLDYSPWSSHNPLRFNIVKSRDEAWQ
jgi:hypothetical protein